MSRVPLHYTKYADEINLFDPYELEEKVSANNKEQLVDYLLAALNEEVNRNEYKEKRRLLHARLNVLPPNSLNQQAVKILNQLLQEELLEKEITDAKYDATENNRVGATKLVVWQGDITTLKIDAIVNAANNQLLGCFQPLHACIDNAIHTAAGVQLRDDCNVIMEMQGFAEPTGVAKITRAYNLPSKYVLHTVGPIVQGYVTDQSRMDLANTYTSCIDICKEIDSIRSIAFCGISTGVFGYPADQAAEVAFETVEKWLNDNPGSLDTVVFNVFSDKDKMIYESLI